MTDLATKSDGGSDPDPTTPTAALPAEPEVRWAEPGPAPSRKHLGWWIGIPAGLVVAGAVAASLILIAPGTSVAGVPVGLLTPGAATDAIQARLAETTISIGDGGQTVSGADLGARLDAGAASAAAFDERPMWNVSQWFGDEVPVEVSLDAEKAAAALRAAAPELYTDPTPATVSFDGAAYAVTPAVDGEGIELDAVRTALQGAFDTGADAATVDAKSVPVAPVATTADAEGTAAALNDLLSKIGFYVGEERTVPVDAATAASWLSVTPDEAGGFAITADSAQIQAVVDSLPGLVDRAPADGTVITNSSDEVLATAVAGADGRALGDTSGIAERFAEQLASGDGVYQLPVEVTPAAITKLHRLLEVDLGEQRLYLKENGVVVDSWLVSTGRSGAAETHPGTFRIGWKTPIQDMRGVALDSGVSYVQPDVRWAMYFNGDQAFHGVYWHSNWGRQMSAGCVGMPDSRAKQIYDWAPAGVDVSIHG